jgi:hypothetical protein
MLEVQEPSDWVVQPEVFCGDTPLDEAMRYGPLSEERALECFAYHGESEQEVRARLFMQPVVELQTEGGVLERLADERYGRCFTVRRAIVSKELALPVSGWRLAINAGGTGTLRIGDQAYPFKPGDSCLLPEGCALTLCAKTSQILTTYLVQA